MIRHFLTLRDLSKDELNQIIDLAIKMKATHKANIQEPIFNGKVLAMIFDKSSTRTRVSFEAGMTQLGGAALFLSPSDTQLGRFSCCLWRSSLNHCAFCRSKGYLIWTSH
jgi:ornithine carbamoyltransferase